jgi:hypothetical protein
MKTQVIVCSFQLCIVHSVGISITSLDTVSPSPDSSGNPFLFFFKKEKIGTDSGK